MYVPDTTKWSLIWGRYGAMVWAMLAGVLGLIGFNVSQDLQLAGVEIGKQAIELLSAITAFLSGILAFWSKIRESRKVNP
jgi:hypothetical protein